MLILSRKYLSVA